MSEPVQEIEIGAEKPKNEPGGLSLGSMVLLASILIAGVIVGVALVRQNRTQPTEGPAPTFSFTTFDGQSYNLEDFRGQVVVLNFWASWCPPCVDEAPELQYVYEEYQDEGVVFLGIAYADNGPNSLRFINEFGLSYLNAPDVGTVISEMYRIQGVPETFVIDQNGDIAEFFMLPVNELQLREVLDPLLEGAIQ
jgi:cytochrome c biogenesis protein CcmG, thiol:disulfide interchange protein DsbE